jgi:type IV secretory pathway VirB6-like protein
MIMFLIKVLFAFLVAFIGLAFMIMLGPLFIPLVLFRATKTYFDKWVEFIITTALQPVLLLTFVTFATAAMDLVIFSGERSVYRTIAGSKAQQPGFNMNKYLMGDPKADPNNPGLYTVDGFIIKNSGNGMEIKGESSPLDLNQIRGSVHGAYTANISDCISRNIGTPVPRLNGTSTTAPAAPPAGAAPAAGGPSLSNIGGTVNNLRDCSRTFIKSFVYREIDFQKLAEARNPAVNATLETGDSNVADAKARQLRRELMASTFLAMVMMFLMNALMRIVPELTNDLTGSLTTTPNYFNLGGQWSAQQMLAQQAGGAARSAGSQR